MLHPRASFRGAARFIVAVSLVAMSALALAVTTSFCRRCNRKVHTAAFAYKTVNTDVLGWVIAGATGRNVAQLLSEKIWSRLGAEQDACFTVDSIGTPFAGGGLNTGLRDLARFGEMLIP